jgi:thioredoxin
MSTTMEHVIEVTDETFERTVIEGSSERPVVVDLWAEWCGPCRTLGPMLEKVAAEREGAFLLAKVDIDANSVGQSLLQAVRSQGIPTVVAFRDGQPVSMFIGAYPEEEVNRFIDSILPTVAELDAKEAEQAAESGDVAAAERGFRDALAEDPENEDAGLGLAGQRRSTAASSTKREARGKHLPRPRRNACTRRSRSTTAENRRWERWRAKRLAAGRLAGRAPGMIAALAEDRDGARQALTRLRGARRRT